jgi:serpin B
MALARPSVAGANRFSLDLYKQAASTTGNLFFSPANVSATIGLAYRGAKGTTAAELRAVLHYPSGPREQIAANAALTQSLELSAAGRELHAANALWVQQGLPLDADFAADVRQVAKGGVQQVDYKHDPVAARGTINRWVSAATGDRIRQLLQPGDIGVGTRLTLVSSLYWKGRWSRPFEAATTKIESFTGIDGRSVSAPLMHQQAQFSTAEHDGIKAIQLPYVGGEVAMAVLMPDKASDFPRFEQALTAEALERWTDELDRAFPRDTLLTLPKMHLAWRGNLAPTLQALGAPTAFGNRADFTGITSGHIPGDGATSLKIARVIHQSWLEVDESGSEAAAATAALMAPGSALRRAETPFVFRADQPFLFLLLDRRTGLILFIGRYVAPPPM